MRDADVMGSISVLSAQSNSVARIAVEGGFSPDGATLSYAVQPEYLGDVRRGQLVHVPLRKQIVRGIVLATDEAAEAFSLRAIAGVVDPAVVLSEAQLRVAEWLARETACSFFSAAAPFLPPGQRHRLAQRIRLTSRAPADESTVTAPQRKVLKILAERGEMSLEALQTAMNSSLTTVLDKLETAGFVERSVAVIDATPGESVIKHIRLIDSDRIATVTHPGQRAVIDYLRWRRRLAPEIGDGFAPASEVASRTGVASSVFTSLARKGIIEEIKRPPGAAVEIPDRRPTPELSEEQVPAWRRIARALTAEKAETLLLHGVTGSGKTELYLRAVAWALRDGRGAIVLAPEIALAGQIVSRFESRFPGRVAVLHSEMTPGERHRSWLTIRSGEKPIVIGPRSALFAPVERIGVIVIDEEHESAYKQEATPRFQARSLAERIAEEHACVVILGSATPSVETYQRAVQGEIERLELTERVDPVRRASGERGVLSLPTVEVVDLRKELHRGNASLLSDSLRGLLGQTLARGEQTMLLLNRRGMATVVMCSVCGTAVQCPHCDIPLVYHQDGRMMLCHRCNYRSRPSEDCSICGGKLDYFGAGTQRVEAEVKRAHPAARVLRWDRDSVAKRGGHARMLKLVESGEVDVLVGTQMIAKGFDLPMVTAVGVIHADALLHLPDFRSAERTFQLVTQVAGRAGRRSSGGLVIVQSYSPRHYAIEAAAKHDYALFFAAEIEFRQRHRYPPFTRLVRYTIRHRDEETCRVECDEMARRLARHLRDASVPGDLLGPAPAFTSKIRGEHQWQIVLRAKPDDFDRLLDGLPNAPGWTVDVDPQSML